MNSLWILMFFIGCVAGLQNVTVLVSFPILYKDGVDAYLDERWEDCINNLEAAIHIYKLSLSAISDCRIKCSNEPYDATVKKDIEDLKFFEKIVKKTLCFVKCKRIRYPNIVFDYPNDAKDIEIMEDLTPYSYLHICFFKMRLYQKAASAAFTYLVKNPSDKLMKNNLEYYMSLPEINMRDVTNFEVPEYLPLYLHGINAYNNEDWQQTIVYMEDALKAYIAGEQRCRALCEGSFDQGWLPDFLSSIANHFTYCLKCKVNCPEKLKTLDGMKGKEILADIYNYLQFAYYKSNDLHKTYRCVASYLLIYPNDPEMIQNKKIYSEKADPIFFIPRPEITNYIQRRNYELELLQFIQHSFTKEFLLETDKPKNEDDDIDFNEV